MMNIACNLSCSVAVMVLLTSTALAYPNDASESLKLNTHTYSRNSIRESTPIQLASVCFVTDVGSCSGGEFGVTGDAPKYDPDPDNRCKNEGYSKVTCNSVEIPTNKCPYDGSYTEKCECKPGLIICNAPSSGIGESCGGKYEKCCNNTCSAGYDLSSGACRQASSLKTACGKACYKILKNTCSTGSLTPPTESVGNRNKIVATTECGNSCWQSFNDNCPTGYVKEKSGGKCYETNVSYTHYGSVCYKEKPCCDDSCSGYKTIPTTSQCQYGYNTTTTGCDNKCYTCKTCNNTCSIGSLIPPQTTGYDKAKIVSTTECGNSCWQTFNNQCPIGYYKKNITNKCFGDETSITEYGDTCYKDISACTNDTCPKLGTCSYETCSQKYCLNSCPIGYAKYVSSCAPIWKLCFYLTNSEISFNGSDSAWSGCRDLDKAGQAFYSVSALLPNTRYHYVAKKNGIITHDIYGTSNSTYPPYTILTDEGYNLPRYNLTCFGKLGDIFEIYLSPV